MRHFRASQNDKSFAEQINDIDGVEIYGRVVGVRGLMVEVAGQIHAISVGAQLTIETGARAGIPCDPVGFSGTRELAAYIIQAKGLDGRDHVMNKVICRKIIHMLRRQARRVPPSQGLFTD